MKDSDLKDMQVIVNHLKPFAEAIYNFSGDNFCFVPFFQTLQKHLAPNKSDIPMIREMNIHMFNTNIE